MPGQISSPNSPSWSSSIPTHPFHFRMRIEPIDWRRMAALDVDCVERETDINVLQEFISAVTFCNVEGERCPQCRCPSDTTLLKVLRMSQLSTEYLLHCQDYLSSQVAALEEQLQGALSNAVREEEKRTQLEKELKEVRLESRHRKKLIATQQLLLQSSANNYHKCQFCEKSFVNYSYLQSHVQRRHVEITDAERQKKMQVEQVKDGLEELKEKLRLTQSQLEAEREADVYRRQQELEEQRRREALDHEMIERSKEQEKRSFQDELDGLRRHLHQECEQIKTKSISIEAELEEQRKREALDREMIERSKEEEKRTFQDELDGLRRHLHQECEQIKTKSISIEAKVHELESRGRNMSNLRAEDEFEKAQWRIREQELMEQSVQKKNKWKMKMKELQNKHQQEKEELEIKNMRLQKALSVKESTRSSVDSLKQQVFSLSSQLRQRDTRIHSQKKKIKKLQKKSRSRSAPLPKMATKDTPEVGHDEKKEKLVPAQVEPVSGVPVQSKNFISIVKNRLQKRLENMGLRKGTKGISTQTLRSLIYERGQSFRSQARLQDIRNNLEAELNQRVRELQRSQGKSTPNTHMLLRTDLCSPIMDQSPRCNQVPQKHESHQPPTAVPRSKAPSLTPILPAQQKKSSTPPFSSEEEDDEESGEDSAYITSFRDKPSASGHLTTTEEKQRAEHELSWSDSNDSHESDAQKAQQAFSTHGSVVQTLTRSLEKQLSSSITKPAGGIRVLPPASQPSPRPSIIKQQAVSEEESDVDLSSIEELISLNMAGRESSDVVVTSGTSIWSSAASRAAAW